MPEGPPRPQPAFEQVIVPPLPQQTAYTPAPSQVYAAPPANSGNNLVKIILIVLGIFVALGLVATAIVGVGIYKVSKAVNLHTKDGGVSISTPDGNTISTTGGSSLSAADVGIPEYPGAKRGEGGMKMKTAEGSLVTATYTTSDSASQVVDFYKAKLGEDASLIESNGNTVLTAGQNTHDKTVVTITPEDGSTKIMVLHAISKKS